MKPPPLPEETLRRVLRVARFNGLSVVIIAGLGAGLSLVCGDYVGAAAGLVAAGGGWLELSGRQALRRGDAGGLRRLERAQGVVLGAILAYALTRLASFDAETAMGGLTPDLRSQLAEAGVDLAAILPLVRLMFYATYGLVALVTLVYQGGMVWYYRRQGDAVRRARAARLRPAAPAPGAAEHPEDWVT